MHSVHKSFYTRKLDLLNSILVTSTSVVEQRDVHVAGLNVVHACLRFHLVSEALARRALASVSERCSRSRLVSPAK